MSLRKRNKNNNNVIAARGTSSTIGDGVLYDVNRDNAQKRQRRHLLSRILRQLGRILTCRCFGHHYHGGEGTGTRSLQEQYNTERQKEDIELPQLYNNHNHNLNNGNGNGNVAYSYGPATVTGHSLDNGSHQAAASELVIPMVKGIRVDKERADPETYLDELDHITTLYEKEKRMSNGHPSNNLALQYAITLSHSEEHRNRAKSIPILVELVKSDTHNKMYVLNLGTTYFKEEQYVKALQCAERILAGNPLDSDALSLKYLAMNSIQAQQREADKMKKEAVAASGVKVTNGGGSASAIGEGPPLLRSSISQIITEDEMAKEKDVLDDDDDETSSSSSSHH
ncbi:hypothetical protein SAMD00019534_029040, partial [Acytostelium subglobosum LB1]|uniref:hypothetical protein n=1 Tax=Acytostelium subglobosum LB1 TaxID=1410327 RepID=UPI00064511DA